MTVTAHRDTRSMQMGLLVRMSMNVQLEYTNACLTIRFARTRLAVLNVRARKATDFHQKATFASMSMNVKAVNTTVQLIVLTLAELMLVSVRVGEWSLDLTAQVVFGCIGAV